MSQSIFAALEIKLDEVSLEKLSHYVAVEYYLTIGEELERYDEAEYHLREVQDEERANRLRNWLRFTE